MIFPALFQGDGAHWHNRIRTQPNGGLLICVNQTVFCLKSPIHAADAKALLAHRAWVLRLIAPLLRENCTPASRPKAQLKNGSVVCFPLSAFFRAPTPRSRFLSGAPRFIGRSNFLSKPVAILGEEMMEFGQRV